MNPDSHDPLQGVWKVLLLAMATAMVGFLAARALLPTQSGRHLPTPVDRRRAEGVERPSGRRFGAGLRPIPRSAPFKYIPWASAGAAPAAQAGATLAPSGPTVPLDDGSPAPAARHCASPSPSALPSPKATRAPMPNVPSVTGAGTPSRSSPAEATPAPAATPRPGPVERGWAAVVPAMVVIEIGDNRSLLGVVVHPDGRVATCYSALGGGEEYTVLLAESSSTTVHGRLVAADPRMDLAILRLDARPTASAALANDRDAKAGDALTYVVAPAALPSDTGTARLVERRAFGAVELMHYNGLTEEDTRGSPLVTESGAVAGVVVGRGWDIPGGAFGLAAPASGLAALLAQDDATDLPSSRPNWIRALGRSMILESIPSPPSRADRDAATRFAVVPGVRLGALFLGMPVGEALQSLSQPRLRMHEDIAVYTSEGDRMQVAAMRGVVVAAATGSPSYGTLHGTGAGLPLRLIPVGDIATGVGIGTHPDTHETAVTGDGIELIGDGEGKVGLLRVLPRTAGVP